MAGKKRASPGAEEEKNPLQQGVHLGDADALRLTVIRKDIARAELLLERSAQLKLLPVWEKRRPIIKAIPKFWAVALMNHSLINFHAQHNSDQIALSHLEDVWVDRDPEEPRCFTIEFFFQENPYFSNTVLKKEYKYVPSPEAANQPADEEGFKASMLDFSWEKNVKISSTKIDWKDADKALTKLYPRDKGEEGDDDDEAVEPGSFFNYFEHDDDVNEIGLTISNEIFPEAIDYFLGEADQDEDDDDDEDDSDEEDIDLEKPKSKKQKV